VNQTEWQPLAVLAAAMLFIGIASIVQRLMARAAARQAAAERAAARPAQAPAPPGPVQSPAAPGLPRVEAPRSDRRAPASHGPLPRRRPPVRDPRGRARDLLRAPAGLKVAILAGEILGPPQGAPRPRGPR
jgi:hypothetical protein